MMLSILFGTKKKSRKRGGENIDEVKRDIYLKLLYFYRQ